MSESWLLFMLPVRWGVGFAVVAVVVVLSARFLPRVVRLVRERLSSRDGYDWQDGDCSDY